MALGALAVNRAVPRVEVAATRMLPIETLPRALGGWEAGPDLPVDEFVRKKLPTARIITRRYKDDKGHEVELMLLTASRREDFHSPNECFPGSGWALGDKRDRTIDGRVFHTMTAEKDGERLYVAFNWFGVSQAEADGGAVQAFRRTVLWNLMQGRADGMSLFVRIVTPDRAAGAGASEDFMRQALPHLGHLLASEQNL